MDKETIVSFTHLRFDYYSNGRANLLNQSPRIGGILLGYAIELSMKMMLEYVGSKKLRDSHSLNDLYEEYNKQNLPNLNVNKDFISFANDRLDQRYPRAIGRVMKWHEVEDRFQDFPVDNIELYDDLICQLDDAAVALAKCNSASILIRGAINLESYPSRAMFHCNHHAKNRWKNILGELEKSGGREIESANFKKQMDSIWNFNYMLVYIPEEYPIKFAKDYRYPEWGKTGNGKKATLVFRNWLPNRK